jgi:uncharacterized damage-inducible protein DinB
MSKQFELTRGSLMKFVKELDEQTADIQPKGFNNHIRWHIGHLLLSGEGFLFGFPKRSTNIPISYSEMFGMGTKPSNWVEGVPALTVLIEQLENQTERIRNLDSSFFEEKLPFKFPFGDSKTYGDIFAFMLYHEAVHIGQIKAMKRVIQI